MENVEERSRVKATCLFKLHAKIDNEKSLTVAREISSDKLNCCFGFYRCFTHGAINEINNEINFNEKINRKKL